MPRSLKIHPQYIPTVKSSLLRNGFPSQKILAEDLGIAQSTVSNFLNGKPVDYANFLEICQALGQEWRNIADLSDNLPQNEVSDFKAKILISHHPLYNRLAIQLQQSLTAAGHNVEMQAKSLHYSDYFLLLLSRATAISEIILETVQLARELHDNTRQKPAILPICLDLPWEYTLPFDLLELLQGIQPWQWHCTNNTSILASELLKLIKESRTSLPSDHEFALCWTNITSETIPPCPPEKKSDPPHIPLLKGDGRGIAWGESKIQNPIPSASPELPEGQVELASRFYIERPPIEARCYETIVQPGALIRIKAPRQMGKTSLMSRILHCAETQGSRAIALNFQLASKRIFTNLDTFLQWFCAGVGLALGQLDSLSNCWQLADIIGSNLCCKAYFEQYLLSENLPPLTLGLDEVDRIFEFPEIADDFLGLLRSLHEESKRCDKWKKFRLIVVHSTEVYIPLDMNKSPFNVGLPIELPEFNPQQVQELARRHGIDCDQNQVEQLMDLVGGHPFLVRLAMYHISRGDMTLDRLIQESATEAGIYSDHLRRHLWNLDKYPEIKLAFEQVVTTSESVRLPLEQGFKLNSMGLVKMDGNDCIPRCKLYRKYFSDRL
jgi:transcriptional regulator with XRE-family HTH domain